MQNYSQGREQEVILNFFKGSYHNTTFLDIGANDGKTLSNSYALATLGCDGVCVEPSPEAFNKLKESHLNHKGVSCLNAAIGDTNVRAKFYHSGSHLNNGDTSLLSTLRSEDYEKWKGSTDFTEMEAIVMDFKTMLEWSSYKQFQFISIDAEGMDLVILKQMDLKALGCRLLCIEHNSDRQVMNEIIEYCRSFDFTKALLKNGENIILSL